MSAMSSHLKFSRLGDKTRGGVGHRRLERRFPIRAPPVAPLLPPPLCPADDDDEEAEGDGDGEGDRPEAEEAAVEESCSQLWDKRLLRRGLCPAPREASSSSADERPVKEADCLCWICGTHTSVPLTAHGEAEAEVEVVRGALPAGELLSGLRESSSSRPLHGDEHLEEFETLGIAPDEPVAPTIGPVAPTIGHEPCAPS